MSNRKPSHTNLEINNALQRLTVLWHTTRDINTANSTLISIKQMVALRRATQSALSIIKRAIKEHDTILFNQGYTPKERRP